MLQDIIVKLFAQDDLSAEEATQAMTSIMTGQAGEARTAAILTALAIKGETATEIEAFARAMRHAAVKWPGDRTEDLCDTCGTGGDGAGSLNISTLSAVILSSLGLRVAKHGNRAVSSTTGSADVFEELGMPLNMEHAEVAEQLERTGLCFLFAPQWHPAMKHAAPIRRALGVRTVFNLLGPLTNPAPISYQVVGVFDRAFMEPVARALAGLRRKGAYVVHSEEGLDEVSPEKTTHFLRIENGRLVDEGELTPADFGFEPLPAAGLRVQDRADALMRTRAVLEGRGQAVENQTVAMNAALLFSMLRGPDLAESAGACLNQLKAGEGARSVAAWVR